MIPKGYAACMLLCSGVEIDFIFDCVFLGPIREFVRTAVWDGRCSLADGRDTDTS